MWEIKHFKINSVFLSHCILVSCYSTSACPLCSTDSSIPARSQVVCITLCFLWSYSLIPHGGLSKISWTLLVRMQMTVLATNIISSHYTIQGKRESTSEFTGKVQPHSDWTNNDEMSINSCGEENVMGYVGLVLDHVSIPKPIRRARSPILGVGGGLNSVLSTMLRVEESGGSSDRNLKALTKKMESRSWEAAN